jgi:uncharacterized protein YbjT (DUF2867 family)
VRLSAFGTLGSRIISELQKAEEDLKASGLPWTILQPTFFMQNLMMTAPTVRGEGRIYWYWGEGRAGMVDIRNVVDGRSARSPARPATLPVRPRAQGDRLRRGGRDPLEDP